MFLGVDGGGTKTAYCLLGRDGTLRARATTAGVYHLGHGLEIVEPLLREGVSEVCAEAGTGPDDIDFAFFGLPAYGEDSAQVDEIDAIPGRLLGHGRYRCGNDMVCGWAGSLGGRDGINVVAGTGSIAYGQFHDARWRGGGWGELFGDEGSAYWIAVRALNTFGRMSDGRLARGPLYGRLRGALGVATDLDAISLVLDRWRGDRSAVAALSRVVSDAADDGDVVAASVLQDAGRELALLVEVGADALGFPRGRAVPVSYSGGVFASERVVAAFRAALDAMTPAVELRRPLLAPDLGAAVHAARLAGLPLDLEQVLASSVPTPLSGRP